MFLMTFFGVAVYVSDVCEREIFKKEDPQNVVIDEVLGYLTTHFFNQSCWSISKFSSYGNSFCNI